MRLAEKLFVTRQAVSRWETGETIPKYRDIKASFKAFDVSINTLLGSPRSWFVGAAACRWRMNPSAGNRIVLFNEEYCK